MIRFPALKQILKRIEHPKQFFGSCLPDLEFQGDFDVKNPFPPFVREEELEEIGDTFTDYAIRKMLRDLVPKNQVISERQLTAEMSLKRLKQFKERRPNAKMKAQYVRSLEKGEQWITTYQTPHTSWKDAIPEMFYLAQLDSFYHEGKLHLYRSLSSEEVAALTEFLEAINDWLSSVLFDDQLVVLHPRLTHPRVCKADADLFLGEGFYAIMTTDSPKEKLKTIKYELLAYVSLYEYLQKEWKNEFELWREYLQKVRDLPQEKIENILQRIKRGYQYLSAVPSITKIGVFLPCSLTSSQVSISDWNLRKREMLLQKLFDKRLEMTPTEDQEELKSLRP